MGHPRERIWDRRIGRRDFLWRSTAGAAALGSAGLWLAACETDNFTDQSLPYELSRPDKPVKLPLFDNNPAIADDLEPEGGTLKLYNYTEYNNPRTLKAFEEEYGVGVEVSTFTTMTEA